MSWLVSRKALLRWALVFVLCAAAAWAGPGPSGPCPPGPGGDPDPGYRAAALAAKGDLEGALAALDELADPVRLRETADFRVLLRAAAGAAHPAGDDAGRISEGLRRLLPVLSGRLIRFVAVRVPAAPDRPVAEADLKVRAEILALNRYVDSILSGSEAGGEAASLFREYLRDRRDVLISFSTVAAARDVGRWREAVVAVVLDTPEIVSRARVFGVTGNAATRFAVGVVGCSRDALTVGPVVKRLEAAGHKVELLGEGSCEDGRYGREAAQKGLDMLLFVTERVDAEPSRLSDDLKVVEGVLEIRGADVYTGQDVFELRRAKTVYDSGERSGAELALGAALENLGADLEAAVTRAGVRLAADPVRRRLKAEAHARATRGPVEVRVERVLPVFANNAKHYAEAPFVFLRLVNHTGGDIEDLDVSLRVKAFMDFPSETRVDRLPASANASVALRAVFNGRLLELTENTPLQARVEARYRLGGAPRSAEVTVPLRVYERHALTWDDRRKIAIFVTPKDPPVMDFSRAVLHAVKAPVVSRRVTLAAAAFEALRALGVTYQADPNNPYAKAGARGGVDYVQYARDTLARKAGDCDDLVVLYASLLESLGIRTAVLDLGDHVMAAFDTGIAMAELARYGIDPGAVLARGGTAWVPVELTRLGEDFTGSWAAAAGRRRRAGRRLRVVDVARAWRAYKPPTLPPCRVATALPAGFPAKLAAVFDRLGKDRNARLLQGMRGGMVAPEEALYVLARDGLLDDALALADAFRAAGVRTPEFLNDLGNVYFLKGRYGEALRCYQAAVTARPGVPFYRKNAEKARRRLERQRPGAAAEKEG
ncbi:hypothetical protein G3N55_03520 [Dissulfurirhabdus thermomarina]|uniref:Uncharacterized protein n=1 Tax=Dissulfurirhabdus thermomarina TaxID=1765737 RepID=A0A6N9TR48_DISTH|nr:tetratricopeptide repeat protein [Dissulfurirhabdus thermomarina]NDY41917.1 hypothetical protein [Dissulfurirhabdus thermomarina]NMX23924.1 hypothetical protein [Dissulfurirhabdus thermomarina]